MDRNLLWKLVLIIVLVVLAVIEVYPPSKTLNPGLDLAGGTSFIYELDTTGLKPEEQRNLAQRTIDVLRKRIDPTNTRNLIWRPQGNNRIEIQVPLASQETIQLRKQYEAALNTLQSQNINLSNIMRSLNKPAEQRAADFAKYAHGSKERQEILDNLAKAYDERKALQQQRDQFAEKLADGKKQVQAAGLSSEMLESSAREWASAAPADREKKITEFAGAKKELIPVITTYVQNFQKWADAVNKLATPETGANAKYAKAMASLDNMNINIDQMTEVLEMPVKSAKRKDTLDSYKKAFGDRADQITKLVAAFDSYRTVRGRLDDPEDLRRMLKGSGVLEFRILPKINDGKTNSDEMATYLEALKTKGPKQASDNRYMWVLIENPQDWKSTGEVIGEFANKYYVLASNKPGETMLHSGEMSKSWRLTGARATADDMGRRAIGFAFDESGGNLFYNLTRVNIGRPLAILLDNVAISAPNINSAIRSNGIIEGTFSSVEVEDMVNKLNAGSLPARLIEPPISIKTIGPSIGGANRDAGIYAAYIGLIAVMAFMFIYYWSSGMIANVALLMNLLFVLAVMALSRATFTLPGIAGVILTLGMAVDANVLIHERIREEQEKGASLRIAIKNGYDRAFLTIFDSNLTTVLTSVVLYLVATEELKGFAITLILGLAASMFTAVFVTRVIFELLLDKKIFKDRIGMLRLIPTPKIDWMKARYVTIPLSLILCVACMYGFFTRDEGKYDIEFTGGTSATVTFKEGVNITHDQVVTRLEQAAAKVGSSDIAASKVNAVGNTGRQYEISTVATNKTTATITYAQPGQTEQNVTSAINVAEANYPSQLSRLKVEQDKANPAKFTVSTTQVNRSLVADVLKTAVAGQKASVSQPQLDEVVNRALTIAFGDIIETEQNLEPSIVTVATINEQMLEKHPELTNFAGGVAITAKLQKPATAAKIESRLNDFRFKPTTQQFQWYPYEIYSADLKQVDPNAQLDTFVYVSALPDAGYRQIGSEEMGQFVDGEKAKIIGAASLESSLPRVTQIDPSLGNQAKVRGLLAIILSFVAIIVYVWVRFGGSRYGFAGVIALVHDSIIATGAVIVATYIYNTPFGQALGIGDFKINLDTVAALLTIIGFSINDTIVIFDRIRENRGRTGILTPQLINDSINQCFSRTVLTTFTAFTVVVIMYALGGTGLRGFNYCMIVGFVAGTYSTIAIAAPIVLLHGKAQKVE